VVDLLSPESPTPLSLEQGYPGERACPSLPRKTKLSYLTKEETIAILKVHFECYDAGSSGQVLLDQPNEVRDSDPQNATEHLYSCLVSAQMTKELTGKVDLTKYGCD